MTPIQELIKNCLDSGWRLSGFTDGGHTTQYFLVPPEGDPRINWCAEWEKVSYDGKSIAVPHWAWPGGYNAKEDI